MAAIRSRAPCKQGRRIGGKVYVRGVEHSEHFNA